tara:strand:- start:26986 stop:28164 length:1179 start_codon:yes stop_codon:yes gene_type:complete
MWEIKDKGFLPESDPLIVTAGRGPWAPTHSFFTSLDSFMAEIPRLIEERKYREEVISFLRSCFSVYFLESLSVECLERLFKHYCYMASSYVHALHETTATRLPCEIAVPLAQLAERLDRLPILSYSCYALNNWCRKDPEQPITIENLELLQNFSHSNKVDEDWFILIHVDIEARASGGISAIKEYRDQYLKGDPPGLIENCDPQQYAGWLKKMHASLRMMNLTMARMPENCSEDFYFKAVRPFIFGFKNVNYEGCDHWGFVDLRGETGAQSSIIPSYVAALEVDHKSSMLTDHLDDMRAYMPKEHREFVKDIESIAAAGQVGTMREMALHEGKLVPIYNSCLEELLNFRTKHLEFAINYIQKQTDDPTGTGGTPFIPWLTQLRDETEARYIK